MTPTLPERTDDLMQSQSDQQDQVAPDYGPNNINLPQQLVDILKAAVKEANQQEQYTRRREVLHDRRNRFYERGYQHVSWNFNTGMFTLGTPGGYITNSSGANVQLPQYIDDYDIFGPSCEILTAALTPTIPPVGFQPINPDSSDDIDKADAAEGYARAFDRMNDPRGILVQIVRMMLLSGRTVTWTRTETDGPKFGYNPDGTPKRFQTTTVYGSLETKVPILARQFDKDFPYCFIYDDPDIRIAKAEVRKYDPEVAKRIRANEPGLGESAYERSARLGILNGTRNQAQIGDSQTHLVSRCNAFLRLAWLTASDAADNPFQGEPGVTCGDKLAELFPEGVRVQFMGETFVGAWAESMDDHINIDFPFPGDGMFRRAVMDSQVVNQDFFNDSMNGAREDQDTGWGSIWINADQNEIDAIRDQRAAPNAIRALKEPMKNAPMEQNFYVEPDSKLPEDFMELTQWIMGPLSQFQVATVPSIWGNAPEGVDTASGQAMAANSAKGRLGTIWRSISQMWARIRYQSALAAAKANMGDVLTVPGDNGQPSITVNMAALSKGEFGCYPDQDGGFPESTPQKRSALNNMLTMAATAPALQELLFNPDNVETFKRLEGFSELVFLPAEARNKQVFEIELLLKQAPVPPDPAAVEAAQVQHAAAAVVAEASGQMAPPFTPPPMRPSIEPEEYDYHQWEFQKCQEWLSSVARRNEEMRGNTAGVENVKLHAKAHQEWMAKLAPPPMAAAGAPGPTGPAPAPKQISAAAGGEQPAIPAAA